MAESGHRTRTHTETAGTACRGSSIWTRVIQIKNQIRMLAGRCYGVDNPAADTMLELARDCGFQLRGR